MVEIQLEPTQEPAKLRIYVGAAPGVGKTYHMLNDAYILKHQQNVDIVIGLVETHGRSETQARIRDIEIVPQREIPYRGVTLKEMDVDAIIARHPHTVIVDELAHTNVPGSKNRKRYEDVQDLLEAGINVWTAVNIQHLETLNDAVNRSANTTIRETVPDSFFKRADEVMNVDLTVDELRNRLRQGKIYAPEKVEQSLANFFRKGNLNMLRELSLRTTAEQVSSRAAEYRRTQGLEQAPIPEKVMVCLSTRPGTERLLRVGSRIAGRLAYVNLGIVRRMRALLLRTELGIKLSRAIFGETEQELRRHAELIRKDPGSYVEMRNMLNRNTDGPDNPLSQVFSKSSARQMFRQFKNVKTEVMFWNPNWLPLIGKLLPHSIENRLASRWGWHLWIYAQKRHLEFARPREIPCPEHVSVNNAPVFAEAFVN